MQMRVLALAAGVTALLIGPAAAQQDKPVLFADKSPAEVYRIVHRAKWAVDADTVLACTSRRAGATPQSVYERLMQERSKLPLAIEVLKEDVRGNTAELLVEGIREDRQTGDRITSRGTITFVKEDGTWRVRHETWTDVSRIERRKLPETDSPANETVTDNATMEGTLWNPSKRRGAPFTTTAVADYEKNLDGKANVYKIPGNAESYLELGEAMARAMRDVTPDKQ